MPKNITIKRKISVNEDNHNLHPSHASTSIIHSHEKLQSISNCDPQQVLPQTHIRQHVPM